MNRSSKAPVTAVRKSNNCVLSSAAQIQISNKPPLGKGHEIPLSNKVKAEAGPPTREDISALRIQRAWLSHLDKTVFQLLKHAICAAEHYVTHEILKKVSPLEADLVKDPSMKCKVRFRLSGETFPPFIVFKIFLHTEGHGYKYFSGKNMLKPSSKNLEYIWGNENKYTFTNKYMRHLTVNYEALQQHILYCRTSDREHIKWARTLKGYFLKEAAVDAYKMMGRKKFHDQVMEDKCLSQKFKITDEIDIVTLKDYKQYSSILDETPASSGGRNNYWRRLNLKNIPRTMIMYDIVDYVESGVISTRLQKEMKYLSQRPRTEEMHQEQQRLISKVRQSLSTSVCQPFHRPYQQQSQIKHLGRRSKQAQMKVEKMRKVYKMAKERSTSVETEPKTDTPGTEEQQMTVFSTPTFDIVKINELESDDKMEKKEERLFAWCQDLYIHHFPSC